jgi:hypothetical protein
MTRAGIAPGSFPAFRGENRIRDPETPVGTLRSGQALAPPR